MTLKRLGFALSIAAVAVSFALHLATFITTLSPVWILPGFFLVFGSVACGAPIQSKVKNSISTGKTQIIGFALLIYAILTFVYFDRTTGGTSSVEIVDGRYVAMYKSQVIRKITEPEYRMFPNLWTRVMTSWLGMMAVFCISSFKLTPEDRSARPSKES